MDMDTQLQDAEHTIAERDEEIQRLNGVISDLSVLNAELQSGSRETANSMQERLWRVEAENRRLLAELQQTQQLLEEAEELHHDGLGVSRLAVDIRRHEEVEAEPDADDKLDDLDKILHMIEMSRSNAQHSCAAEATVLEQKVYSKTTDSPMEQIEEKMGDVKKQTTLIRTSASADCIPTAMSTIDSTSAVGDSQSGANRAVLRASDAYQQMSSPARRRIKSMTSLLNPNELNCGTLDSRAQERRTDLPPVKLRGRDAQSSWMETEHTPPSPRHHATVTYLRRQDVVMDDSGIQHHISATKSGTTVISFNKVDGDERSVSSVESGSSGTSSTTRNSGKKIGLFFSHHKNTVIPI